MRDNWCHLVGVNFLDVLSAGDLLDGVKYSWASHLAPAADIRESVPLQTNTVHSPLNQMIYLSVLEFYVSPTPLWWNALISGRGRRRGRKGVRAHAGESV